MIFIGIGGNLPCAPFGPPRATCGAALELLEHHGIRVVQRSRWFESAPVPISDQPWFVNSVICVETDLQPESLIEALLAAEHELGRTRSVPNAARTVDMDIIDYHGRVIEPKSDQGVEVPHPRLDQRAFVLMPLKDVAPDWKHPKTGQGVDQLLTALPDGQTCRPMPDADGVFGTEWTG